MRTSPPQCTVLCHFGGRCHINVNHLGLLRHSLPIAVPFNYPHLISLFEVGFISKLTASFKNL